MGSGGFFASLCVADLQGPPREGGGASPKLVVSSGDDVDGFSDISS